MFDEGIQSSLQGHNERVIEFVDDQSAGKKWNKIMCDPQTAGGLLASVPRDQVQSCLDTLRAAGYPNAGVIGHVVLRGDWKDVVVQ